MKTVITHFYNEEYLLPWWLEHHKKYFDMGILIDYASTDRSVEICKSICPDWLVVPSANKEFDAEMCDMEVMHYESQIEGWRIALTTTEFLVGNINELMIDCPEMKQWFIPQLKFVSWDPYVPLNPNRPLWDQIKTGVPYKVDGDRHQVYCRSMHNINNVKYGIGRHWRYKDVYTRDAWIFHYGNAISGYQMVKRRMQIQHRMSARDKLEKRGMQHWLDEGGLTPYKLFLHHLGNFPQDTVDCSSIIDQAVSYMK